MDRFDYRWHVNKKKGFLVQLCEKPKVQGQCSLQSSTNILIMSNLFDEYVGWLLSDG